MFRAKFGLCFGRWASQSSFHLRNASPYRSQSRLALKRLHRPLVCLGVDQHVDGVRLFVTNGQRQSARGFQRRSLFVG